VVALHQARWLLPIDTPPIEWGGIVVDDHRIVAVGVASELKRHYPDASATDHGDRVLLPGLINAHTHLELSWMGAEPLPRGDYALWLERLLETRTRIDLSSAKNAAADALAFAIDHGTAAFGDICNDTWVAEVVSARPEVDGVLFHELLGMNPENAATTLEHGHRQVRTIGQRPDWPNDRWTVRPTPHASHSVSQPLLQALAEQGRRDAAPLSIHLAESPAEVELLTTGRGSLRPLFDRYGFTTENYVPPAQGPVEYAERCGLLYSGTLLVHGVQLSRHCFPLLRSRGVTVVTCPRSNRWLGVGTAPVTEFVAAGIPVALGTDSLASVEDLDPFVELAALCEAAPGLSTIDAVRIATLNGARALGLADRLGSLAPGKRDRVLAIDLDGSNQDPHDAVCNNPSARKWIG